MTVNSKPISLWLLINALMVFIMVIIGGLTRLTDSGLSMTDWNFFSGIIPPINEQDWNLLFDEYKKFPEYKIINFDMSISEFKIIFFWEYIHRVWGRLIGLTFVIPFVYFLYKKRISKKLLIFLITILLMGCFQGFMGWYMVSSGLVDKPDVSQYRLASHLSIAFLIYSSLVYLAWKLWPRKVLFRNGQHKILPTSKFSLCYILLFITIISGAFVSGTKAGLSYNNFPFMGDDLVPDEIFQMTPMWVNFFENTSLIQLNHRILATLTGLIILIVSLKYMKYFSKYSSTNKFFLVSITIGIIAQYVLGVSVLINYVPISLGLMHQLGGLVNLTLITLIISNNLRHKI